VEVVAMKTNANQEPKVPHIIDSYIFIPDRETGAGDYFDGIAVYELAALAKRVGDQIAFQVFRLGSRIGRPDWNDRDEEYLRSVFYQLLAYVEQTQLDLRGHLLQISYSLLKNRNTTRTVVAEWASRILNRQISQDAWRRAVDKWAKERNLAPLNLPTGRPRRGKSAK
jgi:hypothetical protein